MGDVINIDDYKPQLLIGDGDTQHVVPLELIEHIAAGRHSPDDVQSRLIAIALLDLIYAD